MANLVIDAVQAVGVASSVLVTIELTDQRGDPVIGYVIDSSEVIVLPTTVTTDASGQVTIDLIPNADIQPGNTCYTVRIANKQFLIQKSAVTQTLFDAIVIDPGDLDPIMANELQDHINDPFGAHPASAISTEPFATISAINVQDALEELYGAFDDASEIGFIPTGDITATDVQAAIVEVDGELHAHVTDTTDSHDASSISVIPAGDLTSTNVQSALTELQADIDAGEAALADHLADTVDAHDASAISVTPTGDLASTTVQSALVELQGDIDADEAALAAHLADTVDAHDASAVSFVPTGTITSTNAQSAIAEAYTDATVYSDAALAVHTSDTVDAHDASAISFIPVNVLDNTDVQSAIAELGESFSTPKTPSGFPDTTSTTIAVTDVGANLQFTITPVGASFDVWLFGDKFTKTAESVLMADGLDRVYYVYYDSAGTLTTTNNTIQPTGFNWATQVPVAIVFRNASGNDLVLFDTRHGLSMDWATRGYLHQTRGTQLGTGLVLSGYTLSPGSPANADNQWALSSGTIINEDLPYAISAVADNSTYTTLYKSGTGTFSTATSFGTAVPFAVSGSDIAYNLNTAGSYSLSPVANGDFVNYLIFCTGSVTTGYQTFAFPEETTYGSLANAVAAPILSPFTTGGFAFSEFFMRYRVTYQRSNAYTTTGRCRTVAVQQITNSQTIITSSSTPTSHNGLTGRDVADTHPAASITFTPTGNIAATNSQAAMAELDTEKLANDGSYAAVGTDALSTRVTGNANPRFTLNADGKQEWGDGTAVLDTNLYRSAADTLKTDDKFIASFTATDTSSFDTTLSVTGNATTDSATAHVVLGGIVSAFKSGTGNWPNAAATGARADARNLSTGTLGTARAMEILHGGQASHGAITTSEGFFVNGPSGTGTITTARGFTLANQGRAGVVDAIGMHVLGQSAASGLNVGIRLDAATTRTLWVSASTNPTTPAGGITFGSSADTNLYRSAADTLKTDDSFHVNTGLGVVSGPSSLFGLNANPTSVLDTAGNAIIPALSKLSWAPAASATDVNLMGHRGEVDTTVTAGNTFTNTASNAVRALFGICQIRGDGAYNAPFNCVTGQTVLFGAGSVTTVRSLFAFGVQQAGTKTVDTALGLDVLNHGASTTTTAIGIKVGAQTNSTNNYGIQLEAASTRTLWVSSNANNTTASAGITFGSSADTTLYRSAANTLATDSNFTLTTAGRGILIKEGTNATSGVATLVAGTIVVSTTKVTANSRIQLTVQSLGTVAIPQAIGVTARTAGTSFTISSAGVTDTSVIAWTIIEPA